MCLLLFLPHLACLVSTNQINVIFQLDLKAQILKSGHFKLFKGIPKSSHGEAVIRDFQISALMSDR